VNEGIFEKIIFDKMAAVLTKNVIFRALNFSFFFNKKKVFIKKKTLRSRTSPRYTE